jgi:hypothetical protein
MGPRFRKALSLASKACASAARAGGRSGPDEPGIYGSDWTKVLGNLRYMRITCNRFGNLGQLMPEPGQLHGRPRFLITTPLPVGRKGFALCPDCAQRHAPSQDGVTVGSCKDEPSSSLRCGHPSSQFRLLPRPRVQSRRLKLAVREPCQRRFRLWMPSCAESFQEPSEEELAELEVRQTRE